MLDIKQGSISRDELVERMFNPKRINRTFWSLYVFEVSWAEANWVPDILEIPAGSQGEALMILGHRTTGYSEKPISYRVKEILNIQ